MTSAQRGGGPNALSDNRCGRRAAVMGRFNVGGFRVAELLLTAERHHITLNSLFTRDPVTEPRFDWSSSANAVRTGSRHSRNDHLTVTAIMSKVLPFPFRPVPRTDSFEAAGGRRGS